MILTFQKHLTGELSCNRLCKNCLTMDLEVFSYYEFIIGETSSYPCIVTSGVLQRTVLDLMFSK